MNPDKALFVAIDRHSITGVAEALSKGANLDARRKSNTPLLDAVFSKNTPIIRMLVAAGAAMKNVQASRDPLNEALNQGDMPTLAALVGADPTYDAIAVAIRDDASGLLGPKTMTASLLRPAWEPLLESLGRVGGIQLPSWHWWLAACQAYTMTENSVAILERYAPLPVNAQELIPLLAKSGMAIPVFEAFKRAQLLDEDALFGREQALLVAMKQRYKAIPAIKWLIRHANSLARGPELIKQDINIYMALAVGMHASMPLARMLAKIAQVDPMVAAAGGRMGDGTTALHMLMHRTSDTRRCLEITRQLLAAGADPLAKNATGEPACYRALFKDRFTPQAIRLFADYSVNWMEGGEIWARLPRENYFHFRWVQDAMEHVRVFTIEQQHQLLQEATPDPAAHGAIRRV